MVLHPETRNKNKHAVEQSVRIIHLILKKLSAPPNGINGIGQTLHPKQLYSKEHTIGQPFLITHLNGKTYPQINPPPGLVHGPKPGIYYTPS